MRHTTLVFIFSPDNEILLCLKKRWFGEGKRNGPGGKVEKEETPLQAAIREVEEETSIILKPEQLTEAGLLEFSFQDKDERHQKCHVFVCRGYAGTFMESEEMKPQRWSIEDIPYSDMREDDYIRLPELIVGQQVQYKFLFNKDGHLLSHQKTE